MIKSTSQMRFESLFKNCIYKEHEKEKKLYESMTRLIPQSYWRPNLQVIDDFNTKEVIMNHKIEFVTRVVPNIKELTGLQIEAIYKAFLDLSTKSNITMSQLANAIEHNLMTLQKVLRKYSDHLANNVVKAQTDFNEYTSNVVNFIRE